MSNQSLGISVLIYKMIICNIQELNSFKGNVMLNKALVDLTSGIPYVNLAHTVPDI